MRSPSTVANGARPVDARQQFGAEGERIERAARQAQRPRPPADDGGDVEQHLPQRDVLAAEDVALADPAALQRREMARRDVVDMDEVQVRSRRTPASGRTPLR